MAFDLDNEELKATRILNGVDKEECKQMNIEESIEILKNSKNLYLKEKIDSDILEVAIETLLTAYEKEKEITKNAIYFLKYYNKDFNEMSDNEIKQILYFFDKCADIKKEE